MKKIIIYGFMSLMILAACRKSDNERVPELTKVPLPLLKKDPALDQTISFQTPDAFSAKFSVGLFYPNADKPSRLDLVIRKNEDNASVKSFGSAVTTYPTDVTITGVQLRELFGAIALGDKFDFGVDVTTQDGRKFLAFPTVGVPYGAGFASVAGSSPTVRYEAVCKFTMTDYGAIGATVPFTVVADGWGDYAAGNVVNVKIIDATHMSFEYGTTNNVQPIVITVDPTSNATSAARVAYGDYGDGLIFSAQSVAGSLDNNVAPCNLTVGVRLNHTSSRGNYGDYTITLRKR